MRATPNRRSPLVGLTRLVRLARRGSLVRLARRGFTLLEVMVAIAIAAFVTAALYATFSVQSRQFITQDLQMEMNQNMRFAVDMVSRSVRMAGYGTSGYITGVLGPSNPGNSSEANQLPAIIPWDANGSNGTDAITVVYADPSLMMDSSNIVVEACGTTSVTFRPGMMENATKLTQYESGDLLICFDYADMRGMETYLWEISGAPDLTSGAIPVTDNSALTDYAAVCGPTENLTPVMTCSKANVYTFYVDDISDGVGPGSPDHPTLMLDLDMDWPADDDIPLVDDIEDLQFEYCLAGVAGSVDCSVATNWVDGSSITPATQAHDIWMVRMSLAARSTREEPEDLYPGGRRALANRSAGTTSDHYLRQYFSTEISVRNLRYQANL
jgi:type IV pilus assembly protein PilW